jgi:hypothetical protein
MKYSNRIIVGNSGKVKKKQFLEQKLCNFNYGFEERLVEYQ